MTASEIHDIALHVIGQVPHASLRRPPLLTDSLWTIEVCHPSLQFFWLRVPIRDRELGSAADRTFVEAEIRAALRHLTGPAGSGVLYAAG